MIKRFRSEMKQIKWTSRKNLSKQTLYIFAAASVISLMLTLFDMACRTVISWII